MNAYLPTLAKESPQVVAIQDELLAPQEDNNLADPEVDDSLEHHRQDEQLLPDHPSKQTLAAKYDAVLSVATSRISSQGIAMGYAAGIFLLIIALVPVTVMHGSTFSLRLAIGLSGIWWAVFSVPAWVWLPEGEPGEVVEGDRRSLLSNGIDIEERGGGRARKEDEWSAWKEVKAAWVRLGGMLRWREVKRLRNTFRYLAAWFLLSDGAPSFHRFLYP
jgi:MFS transporter, UMF1 family